MPKVSIIVPIYNAEKYLEQCLDSVVKQTLKDIEIIMVNDGSTDGSEQICEKFFSDPRVIYYKKENEGLAAARQDGIDRASGDYIGFVDSDDWIEPDMFEKMYTSARENDADIVFCNCYENESRKNRKYLESGVYDREGIINEILPRTLSPYDGKQWTILIRWSNCLRIFRRKMLLERQIEFGRRFRRCQDLPFTFEATLCAQKYIYIGDEYLYHNRVVPASLSRGYTMNMWPLLVPLIERLYSDCAGFQEMGLSRQMDACAFMFAVNSVRNESYKKNTVKISERLKNIKRIVNDPITQKCLTGIEFNLLPEGLKKYYFGLKKKNEKKLLVTAWHERRFLPWKDQKRRNLRNNQFLYKVYKTIKGK